MKEPVIDQFNRNIQEGRPCVLAVLVQVEGSVPRKVGARMLIAPGGATVGTIGGGALEARVIQEADDALRAGQPRLLSFDLRPDLGMMCGGRARVYIEPFLGASQLWIFGAGHIGHALCPLAATLGFQITVLDHRPELATPERFPGATHLIHGLSPEHWGGRSPDRQTYCVVATAGHQTDTEVVAALMDFPVAYLGMIGSKTKRLHLERELARRGIPEPRIAAIHTPMGLPIAAESPEEIAVSIAAELVQVRAENRHTTDPKEKEKE